ncbi:MAG TPA: hypothetical protein VHP38_04780 [Ruminiclostridium sp.]|nr:hypothetical protein [Ruminiclostridium sp.]
MEMIDRYIYAVTQHLPENIREDVSKELRSNIEDMLPEDATEEQTKEILEKLGHPARLADEYNPGKRYLIGPGLYRSYISLLKLVAGIAALTLGCIALFSWVFNPPAAQNSGNLVSDVLSGVFEGALQGAFWVTIVFAFMERGGVNGGYNPFAKNKWTLKDLPRIPDSSQKPISRRATTVEMIFTVLITTVLVFRPEIICFTVKGSQLSPILDTERLKNYIIFIILLAVIRFGILVWKTISPYWGIPLAGANAAHNTGLCILLLIMVRDTHLVSSKFLIMLKNLTDLTLPQVTSMWQRGLWIFAAFFIAVTIYDSMSTVLKCKR